MDMSEGIIWANVADVVLTAIDCFQKHIYSIDYYFHHEKNDSYVIL